MSAGLSGMQGTRLPTGCAPDASNTVEKMRKVPRCRIRPDDRNYSFGDAVCEFRISESLSVVSGKPFRP